MNKIAIYQKNSYHTEIFLPIIQSILPYSKKIDIYFTDHEMSCINLCKQLVSNIELFDCDKLYENVDEYDKIIMTTSNDKADPIFLENNKKKIIFFHHKVMNRCKYGKSINLFTNKYNYNKSSFLYKHVFFPVAYGVAMSSEEKYLLGIVGTLSAKNHDFEDFKLFLEKIEEKQFNVLIIGRDISEFKLYAQQFSEINKNKLIFFDSPDTNSFLTEVNKCKFLTTLAKQGGVYHEDIMTGTIPLSFLLNKPLVTDKIILNKYQLTNGGCICYNKFSDVSKYITSIPDDDFENLKRENSEYCKNVVKENTVTMGKIFGC